MIVVDDDIDIHDWEAIEWALCYRVNAGLGDISLLPARAARCSIRACPWKTATRSNTATVSWTRVLIDATINWQLQPQEQYGGNRYPPWARPSLTRWPKSSKGDGANMDSKVDQDRRGAAAGEKLLRALHGERRRSGRRRIWRHRGREIFAQALAAVGLRRRVFQLCGLEGITGMYVGKIAPGAATAPERHLYEKVIYILQGEGVAEIQQRDRVPQNFWQTGSLFSPPMNTLHRLMNYSDRAGAVFGGHHRAHGARSLSQRRVYF